MNESQAVDSGGIVFVQTSNVNYNCIVSFLGGKNGVLVSAVPYFPSLISFNI